MPTLFEIDPTFVNELRLRLWAQGQSGLAAQLATLNIVGHCDCDMSGCATMLTANRSPGGRRSVHIEGRGCLIVVDAIDGQVVDIEVLDHPALRAKLDRTFGSKQR